jgi:hypothetical protein
MQKFVPDQYVTQSFWREIRRVGAWTLKFLGICLASLFFLSIIYGFVRGVADQKVFHWMPLELIMLSVDPSVLGQDLMAYGMVYLQSWKEAFSTPFFLIYVLAIVGVMLLFLRVTFGQILAFTSVESTFRFSYEVTKRHTLLLLRVYLLGMLLFAGVGAALHPVYTLIFDEDVRVEQVDTFFSVAKDPIETQEIEEMPIKKERTEALKKQSLGHLILLAALQTFFEVFAAQLVLLSLIVIYQKLIVLQRIKSDIQ